MRHLLALAALLPAVALAGDLVGPETCKACHPAAYASWREGPHARALEALPERSRADRRCLSCHAPAAEERIAGVGCEDCHGPGRLYAARYVMRDRELARALGLVEPGEKACLGCHTESTPSLRRFDFKQKVKLIAHPEPRGSTAAGAPSTTPAR
ncbi:MAG TPA: multiheme c-type cytochrome [Anaeromyxobacteraceae bacterium]|nr:multiheme c-type cytochrome [Anaeromyxobacteraceae bacterium]